MLNKNNNKPINIGMLEISSQNKAILEFFFDGAGKALFKEVNPASASAFIIDYDYPGAKESWQNHFNETNKPGILMSVHELELPSAIWIAKPLTTTALVKAGEKVQAMIADANEGLAEQNTTVALEETHSSTTNIINNPQEIGLIEESTPAPVSEESLEKIAEFEVNSVKETVTADISLDAPLSNPEKTSNLQHDRSGSNEISNEHIAEVEDLLQSLMAGTGSKPTEQEPKVANTQSKNEFFEDNNINLDAIELDLVEDSEQAITEKETAETKVEETLDSLDKSIQDFSLLKEMSLEKDTQSPEYEFNLIDNQTLEVLETASDEISIDMVNIEEKPKSDSNQEIDKLINIDKLSNTVEREDIEPHITSVGKEQSTSEIKLVNNEDGDNKNQYLIENEKTSVGLEDHREITLEETPLDEEKARAEEAAKISAESLAKIDSFSNQEATVVIDKNAPLSAEEELQRLLDEIREEAENSKLIERGEGESSGLSSDNATDDTEERWSLICGKNGDIKNEKEFKKIAYNDKNYISAIFKHVLEKIETSHKVMRIKLGKTIIVVDTEHDNVYCNSSIFDTDFADICFEAIDKNDIKIHNLDKSEVRMYLRKAETRPENTYSIEAFIWTTTLLSSRGRLPKGTDINLKIGLKHWPNITRLETFPHIIQIAAVFKKHPGSLLDIAKWLEIPQSSVFAFYNGALALNLIEFDQEKLEASTTLENSSEKKKENRGFFSRLLKRITR